MGASMFWAGALMAFTPIICAAVVIGIWWIQRKKKTATSAENTPTP
jgi:hypothetical protein